MQQPRPHPQMLGDLLIPVQSRNFVPFFDLEILKDNKEEELSLHSTPSVPPLVLPSVGEAVREIGETKGRQHLTQPTHAQILQEKSFIK